MNDDACPCIPIEVHERWVDMTIEERLPYVQRHMTHVWAEVLAPMPPLYKKFIYGDEK